MATEIPSTGSTSKKRVSSNLEPKSSPTVADLQAKDQLLDHGTGSRTRGRLPKPEMVDSQSKILWEYVIPVIAFHVIAPVVLIGWFSYIWSWWGLLFLPIGNYIFTSMGIGAGYHRLLTHRGFDCPKWFEYTLAMLGVCSFQDSPARWVLVHRVHHQYSDHRPDPHTPRVSAFWAHMGWLFVDNRALSTASAYDKYVRDIISDPLYMWLQRGLNWVWVYFAHGIAIGLLGMLVGLGVGGTTAAMLQYGALFLFWGVIMRTIFTWHVTWGINSAAHIWGYRNYETREDSTNNWLFAFLTNGEGWHNNHHADPRSAQHGHRWWEIDVTYMTLNLLEKIGLIKGLVRPNRAALQRKAAA